MSREAEEFLPYGDAVVRAVAGPRSRHAALIEDALHVLVETPGAACGCAGTRHFAGSRFRRQSAPRA